MKNFNDAIGNRLRDLPSYSAVPQLVPVFSCYFSLSIETKHTYTRVVIRNAVLLQEIHHCKTHTPARKVLFQHRSEHFAHTSAT